MVSISVVHTIAGLHPKLGGPSRSVTHLTDELAMLPSLDLTLITQSYAGEPILASDNPKVKRIILESSSSFALRCGLPVRQYLMSRFSINQPSLIHGHGLWHPVNHWTAKIARKWNTPIILHPRGMLEAWAISHKSLKKQIGLFLYQRHDLKSAKVIVATAESEYDNLRQFGLRQPIAVIPNGIYLPSTTKDDKGASQERRSHHVALFLSRIQAKKGLLNLIRAWSILRPAGWRLQIAGPNEDDHLGDVLALARKLNVSDLLDYIGEVDGVQKSKTYFESDIFVLPSFSENFGLVVVEAMAHGLPVITTKATPWSDLTTYECGWWIEPGVDPLVNALRAAINLSDNERRVMGQRARNYVSRYNWPSVATQMAEVYNWALGLGPLTDSIRLD